MSCWSPWGCPELAGSPGLPDSGTPGLWQLWAEAGQGAAEPSEYRSAAEARSDP